MIYIIHYLYCRAKILIAKGKNINSLPCFMYYGQVAFKGVVVVKVGKPLCKMAPHLVSTWRRWENCCTPGDRTPVMQLTSSHFSDRATLARDRLREAERGRKRVTYKKFWLRNLVPLENNIKMDSGLNFLVLH
jgi:hypothetical protein